MTESMIDNTGIAYRMSLCKGGSDRLGPCEICDKDTDRIYLLTAMQTYTRADGSVGISYMQGLSKFGHWSCLSKLTE